MIQPDILIEALEDPTSTFLATVKERTGALKKLIDAGAANASFFIRMAGVIPPGQEEWALAVRTNAETLLAQLKSTAMEASERIADSPEYKSSRLPDLTKFNLLGKTGFTDALREVSQTIDALAKALRPSANPATMSASATAALQS